jgi:hypothetical protein
VASTIAVEPDGNVYVTGTIYYPDTQYDIVTVAYSRDGVPLWTNRFEGGGQANDELVSRQSLAVVAKDPWPLRSGPTPRRQASAADFVTVLYHTPTVHFRATDEPVGKSWQTMSRFT